MDNRLFDEAALPDYAVLSIQEVQEAFGIKERTYFKWVSQGKFPKPRKYPGKKGYPVALIREYLRNQAEEAVREARGEAPLDEPIHKEIRTSPAIRLAALRHFAST